MNLVIIEVSGGIANYRAFGEVEVIHWDYDNQEADDSICLDCGNDLKDGEIEFCSPCKIELERIQQRLLVENGISIDLI